MNILFIDTAHPFLIEALRNAGHTCVEGYDLSQVKLIPLISETDGIVIRSRIRLDKAILSLAKNLRFIARAGAGMESIDVDFAKEKKIVCINSPEGNRDAVGEHAIGMLLSLMNNLNRADRQVRQNQWSREINRGHELKGKTVGIIGMGNMGSAFAEKLRGFDCTILGYDKYTRGFQKNWIQEVPLSEIYSNADMLSIHVPLTDETAFMVDDSFISQFKRNFYFINTARGKCVKTDDLVKHIKSGKIYGACLDVIEYEDVSFEKFSITDFSDNPSWQYLINSDKVILSPHIAGWTFESLEKIARVLFEKIQKVVNT